MTDKRKIVVLDDDPTGTQTVHHVSVFTDWEEETLRQAFDEPRRMFYLLTNSRSFTEEKTQVVHREIAQRLCKVSRQSGKEFILISRGDSTLRGHFPLETETLKKAIEAESNYRFDGEILCPFFPEGNRVTKNDIHYVIDQGRWIPAGETEFARDVTFGYHSSNLRDYVEEKSGGRYTAPSCMSFSVEELEDGDVQSLTDKLCTAKNFQKIIVNALDYKMLSVFCSALLEAMNRGHHFLMRTAASFPKVMGGIRDIPLLNPSDIVDRSCPAGGVVIIGSHVKKTTEQLNELRKLKGNIAFTEFNVSRAGEDGWLKQEADRVRRLAQEQISSGITSVIYTGRSLIRARDEENSLRLSVRISEALTGIVGELRTEPAFILAKGGITSSDVVTKSLHVRCAEVMGQISPGVPVWSCGPESLFPGLRYIIFPGNVGNAHTLYNIVSILIYEQEEQHE